MIAAFLAFVGAGVSSVAEACRETPVRLDLAAVAVFKRSFELAAFRVAMDATYEKSQVDQLNFNTTVISLIELFLTKSRGRHADVM